MRLSRLFSASSRPAPSDPRQGPSGLRSPQATQIVGCILTRDEARNIRRAVTSLQAVTDRIVVVDSESTDDTVAIAESLGAVVLVHRFEDYSSQRNWALSAIRSRYGEVWVFSLDADEWISEELAIELRRKASTLGEDADQYIVRRRIRFDGRVLRHGGLGGIWLTRLFPVSAIYEARSVNEHVRVADGARIGQLTSWLEHSDVNSWEQYVTKHNQYSSLEAAARLEASQSSARLTIGAARRDRTLRRRWLRERVWNRLPARPAIRFVQIYILLAGFLDGRAGFRRALFEAWQEMMTDLKTQEMSRT
jgi:glycosyltransferase involved in cell wall biosynthesis